MTGWDVSYGRLDAEVRPHLCRVINCGGGMEFEEANNIVANFYENVAAEYRNDISNSSKTDKDL